MSLKEQSKQCTPEELITLVQTLVERVYVIRNGKEEVCHIFIKGCKNEDYDDFFVHSPGCSKLPGGEFVASGTQLTES